MKGLLPQITVSVLLVLLFTACSQAPSPAEQVKKPASDSGTPVSTAGWERQWESLLVEARKEQEVVIYTNINPGARTLMGNAFKDKYGITLNFLAFTGFGDLQAKVILEKQGGLYLADVFVTGSTTLATIMKPQDLLRPVNPILIHPEALAPKGWRGGVLPFVDRDLYVFDLIGAIWGGYLRNTDLVREGEITSYLDVLKPSYKGKIVFDDPAVPGSGNAFIAHLAQNLFDTEKALDFLQQLMKQEAQIIRDRHLQTEWVARGRYPVLVGPDSKETATFLDVGAPIALVWPKEGAYTSSVGGSLGLPTRSPHPNATSVFVNWLLTKEGQTLFSQGFGLPSNRNDIQPEINPKMLPPSDLKIFPASEDYLKLQAKLGPMIRDTLAKVGK